MQGLDEEASGRDWDNRFTTTKIPQYDAFNDRFCKFSMRRRAPSSNRSKAPPPNPMMAWGSGSAAPPAGNDRLPQLQHQSATVPGAQKSMGDLDAALSTGGQSVEQLFTKAKQRIIKLWDELGVAEAQRMQFAHHAMALPTLDNVAVINEEIQRLLDRRNAAVQVEKTIEIREGFLYLLQELSERYSNGVVDKDRGLRELLSLVPPFRNASLDVVESIVRWRETLRSNTSPPYLWKGVSYLHKMNSDLFFMVHSRLGLLLDFEVRNNALLDPRKQVESVAPGKLAPIRRAKDNKDLPKERLDKAERVLQEELQRQQHIQLLRAQGGDADVMVVSEEAHLANLARDEEEQQQLIIEEDEWLQQQEREAKLLDAQSKSAIKIQKTYRGFVARKFVGARIRQRLAVIKMQTIARQFIAKCRVEQLRRKVNAAKKLQALHRGGSTRGRILEVRRHHDAATTIQRVFRGHLGRKYADLLSYLRMCARKIQALWRGHVARKYVTAVVRGQRNLAATKIQSLWRGTVVRMNPLFSASRVKCAVRIQAWVRGILDREFARKLMIERRSAIRLQSWWRMLRAKQLVSSMRQSNAHQNWQLHLAKAHAAATKIQSVWRMFDGSRRVSEIRGRKLSKLAYLAQLQSLSDAESAQEEYQRHFAACQDIQRAFRGHQGRRRVQLLRSLNYFATQIQRIVRGKLGRNRALRQREHLAQTMPAIFKMSAVPTATPSSIIAEGIRMQREDVDASSVDASVIEADTEETFARVPHESIEQTVAPDDSLQPVHTIDVPCPEQPDHIDSYDIVSATDKEQQAVIEPLKLRVAEAATVVVLPVVAVNTLPDVAKPPATVVLTAPLVAEPKQAIDEPKPATLASTSAATDAPVPVAPIAEPKPVVIEAAPVAIIAEPKPVAPDASTSAATEVPVPITIIAEPKPVVAEAPVPVAPIAEPKPVVIEAAPVAIIAEPKPVVAESMVAPEPILVDSVQPATKTVVEVFVPTAVEQAPIISCSESMLAGQEKDYATALLRSAIGACAARRVHKRQRAVRSRAEAVEALTQEKHFAAKSIQRFSCTCQRRQVANKASLAREATAKLTEATFAANVIQAWWHDISHYGDVVYAQKRRVQVQSALAAEQERTVAATKIQALSRSKVAASNIQRIRVQCNETLSSANLTASAAEANYAAQIIQSCLRRVLAQSVARQRAATKPAGEYFSAVLQEQTAAATLIQSIVRRFFAQLCVDKLRTKRHLQNVMTHVEVVSAANAAPIGATESTETEMTQAPLVIISTLEEALRNEQAKVAALELRLQQAAEAATASPSPPVPEVSLTQPTMSAEMPTQLAAVDVTSDEIAAVETAAVETAAVEIVPPSKPSATQEISADVPPRSVTPEAAVKAPLTITPALAPLPVVFVATTPAPRAAATTSASATPLSDVAISAPTTSVTSSSHAASTAAAASAIPVPAAPVVQFVQPTPAPLVVKRLNRDEVSTLITAHLRCISSSEIVAYWREKSIKLQWQLRRSNAACSIQRLVRQFLAKRRVASVRESRMYAIQERNEALAREKRERDAANKLELARAEIANQVQRDNEIRDVEVRREVERLRLIETQRKAATAIQCAYRSYNARFMLDWKRRERHAKRIAQERIDYNAAAQAAAVKIQKHIRRFVATRRVQRLREDKLAVQRAQAYRETLRHIAATKIQCMFRCHNARFEVAWRREDRSRREAVEAEKRKVVESRALDALREKEMLQRLAARQVQAAITIQCAWRCYNARFELMWRVEAKAKSDFDAHLRRLGAQLCRTTQRIGRGFVARKRLYHERAFAHTLAAQELLLAEYEADSVINAVLTG
ncbi:IQ calmodulin-binding protein, putative [Bodo saltans]|uniref:IQ calmodulin-binding protein, putative n=1 Tax=Bodo saltans TaxID=75058 RepID=A0A0S4ISU1_BODSA|nr:IQ calmodulin-binding protein, putative [Bodo saltans]|eukprot:CUF07710.1 IQ calmodulin-binding protein, putative [Bodo saltans]